MKALAAYALALALALAPRPALAEPEAKPPQTDGHRLHWTFRRFSSSEYVTSALLTGMSLYLERGTRGLPDNDLHAGVLLDDVTRDALVARSPEGRASAANASDLLWPALEALPVVDSVLTPLLGDHGNVDVAAQQVLLAWEVKAVTFLATRTTHRIVGRDRPLLAGCREDPDWDPSCKKPPTSNLHASFLSGHSSASFASAGLYCSNHIAMRMYGSKAVDYTACGVSLGAATTVAWLRIRADKHWMSDIAAGTLLGLATGFGMPALLHYGVAPAPIARVAGHRFAVLPMPLEGGAGLAITSL